jgi:hypothetical protein
MPDFSNADQPGDYPTQSMQPVKEPLFQEPQYKEEPPYQPLRSVVEPPHESGENPTHRFAKVVGLAAVLVFVGALLIGFGAFSSEQQPMGAVPSPAVTVTTTPSGTPTQSASPSKKATPSASATTRSKAPATVITSPTVQPSKSTTQVASEDYRGWFTPAGSDVALNPGTRIQPEKHEMEFIVYVSGKTSMTVWIWVSKLAPVSGKVLATSNLQPCVIVDDHCTISVPLSEGWYAATSGVTVSKDRKPVELTDPSGKYHGTMSHAVHFAG